MKPHQFKAWTRAQKTARRVLVDQDYGGAVLEQAHRKALRNKVHLKKTVADFHVLHRLIRATLNGSYPFFSKKKLVLAFGVLIYFLNPFDAIPDFILPGGLVDDSLLFLWLAQNLRSELNAFLRFEDKEKRKKSQKTKSKRRSSGSQNLVA